jgi:hypothetical protein
MTLAGDASEQEQNKTFRVSRNAAPRSRQGVSLDVDDMIAYVEKDTRRTATDEGAKRIHPSVPTPVSRSLARTNVVEPGIQQESAHTSRDVTREDYEIKEDRRFASDTTQTRLEAKLAQATFGTTDTAATIFPTLPLNQAKPAQPRQPVVNGAPDGQPLTAKENVKIPGPLLPLAQAQNAASQYQTGAPQFVWRKSTDALTIGDLLSDLSSSSPLAAVRQALDSLPVAQSRPGSQSVKPAPPSREDRSRIEEITTEGMLRRISTMLLIERERRGY